MARESWDDGSFKPGTYEYTSYSPSSLGGVAGVYRKDAGGGVSPVGSSQLAQNVDRYRDKGEQMQARDPYKFNWHQERRNYGNSQESAGLQGDAASQWEGQARGLDRTSYKYGKSLLDRGAQNQQAAALSTSGGALAQVGAAQQAANNRGAYMQKGMQSLDAQQADDMAAGRAGWAGALGQRRQMDAAQQGLSDQQTELQANAAAQQRKLNDAGQYEMEKMGQGWQKEDLAAKQHLQALGDEAERRKQAARDADANRTVGYMSTAGSALGGAFGGPAGAAAGGAAGSALGESAVHRNDPNGDPTSDERAKDTRPVNDLIRLSSVDATPDLTGREKPFDREAALAQAREDVARDSKGAGGAPRGYAKKRAGQAGDMFYGGEAKVSSWDTDHGVAPGTQDFMKHGNPEGPGAARTEAHRADRMDAFSKAVMTSDERAKNKVETPEEKKAREDKQDADDAAAFMKDVPKGAITVNKPSSYEEASKRIDERNAQDKVVKEMQKREAQAPAVAHANKADAETAVAADRLKGVPIIGKMVRARVDENLAQSDDDKAARGTEWRKAEMKQDAASRDSEAWAVRKMRPAFYQAMSRIAPNIGTTPAPRQPKSFQFGDPRDRKKESVSDGRAKSKAALSGYEDTSVRPLAPESKDGGDVTLEWDNETKGRGHSRDVVLGAASADDGGEGASFGSSARRKRKADGTLVNMADAERARAEAIQKMKEARAQEARRVPRKMSEPELLKAAADMGAGIEAQRETLKSGPSVTDRQDEPRWLREYMTSDEQSKDKRNPLIELQKGANRALRGETYTYKQGFGEDPNQLHHGFMAQNLEKNPITRTAVREDETGLKKVNNEDALRVTAAGVASLQEQQDQLEDAVNKLAARRGKGKVA